MDHLNRNSSGWNYFSQFIAIGMFLVVVLLLFLQPWRWFSNVYVPFMALPALLSAFLIGIFGRLATKAVKSIPPCSRDEKWLSVSGYVYALFLVYLLVGVSLTLLNFALGLFDVNPFQIPTLLFYIPLTPLVVGLVVAYTTIAAIYIKGRFRPFVSVAWFLMLAHFGACLALVIAVMYFMGEGCDTR